MAANATDVLDEAGQVLNGPRQDSYGDPVDTQTRIGRAWGALLDIDDIHPAVVAQMMVALKLVRDCKTPGHDNKVDAASYCQVAALADLRIPRT
jgi:hypothetical protein